MNKKVLKKEFFIFFLDLILMILCLTKPHRGVGKNS